MDDKEQHEFNTKAHKLSLSRRSTSVKKKASELAVLCDASLCLIQFDQEGQLKTFPEDATEVDNILKRYLCVGGRVTKKRKVSGLTFRSDKVKKPDHVLVDIHEKFKENSPNLGDEWLDSKSAPELQNFKHLLDVKIMKLEERIRLLKGTKSPEKKLKTPTIQQYLDGTPFNSNDLQLSCNFSDSESFLKQEGTHLAASPFDPSPLPHNLRLAVNNVTKGRFPFSKQPPTNSSSFDNGIQEVNFADNSSSRDSGSQLFYQDGMPCSLDDHQMSINICDADNSIIRRKFNSNKLSHSSSSYWDSGYEEMDSADEKHNWLEDTNYEMRQQHALALMPSPARLPSILHDESYVASMDFLPHQLHHPKTS